jgi:SOS-response transcriptional repressor LexA
MKDFAWWLNYNRERAGLNQAQLAERVGQSGSYISMLESRRKPPPSDEVVRKIARALNIEETKLLEVAHLERTPPDIQRKVLSLDRMLKRERKSHKTLVDRLLPAALFPIFGCDGPPNMSHLPLPEETLEHLQQFAAALSGVRDFELFSQVALSLFEDLDDGDKELLLDLLGHLSTDPQGPDLPADGSAQLPIFLDVPQEPVAEALTESTGHKEVGPHDYSPTRYCLIINGNEMHPLIQHGDYVIVDQALRPGNGDQVAILTDGEGRIARYLELGDRIELAPLNPQHPPLVLMQQEEVRRTVHGVVVRIIRDLK